MLLLYQLNLVVSQTGT